MLGSPSLGKGLLEGGEGRDARTTLEIALRSFSLEDGQHSGLAVTWLSVLARLLEVREPGRGRLGISLFSMKVVTEFSQFMTVLLASPPSVFQVLVSGRGRVELQLLRTVVGAQRHLFPCRPAASLPAPFLSPPQWLPLLLLQSHGSTGCSLLCANPP